MVFSLLLIISSTVAGAIASVTGFGIGSLLTPLLATQFGTKIAVAAVSIPHLFATALRFWILRAHVDKKILIHFGIMSAAGGLLGAVLHTKVGGPALTLFFAFLLLFAGFTGVTGLAQKMRFEGASAWIAGFLSGSFGGLVGNQGGIRSAALLGFDISKEAFVATSTAIGVVVDGARMPVYFYKDAQALIDLKWTVTIMTISVVVGTLLGMKFLRKIPQVQFRKIVSGFIFLLGIYMFFNGISQI